MRVLLERAGGRQHQLRGGGAALRRGAPLQQLGPAPRQDPPAPGRGAGAAGAGLQRRLAAAVRLLRRWPAARLGVGAPRALRPTPHPLCPRPALTGPRSAYIERLRRRFTFTSERRIISI